MPCVQGLSLTLRAPHVLVRELSECPGLLLFAEVVCAAPPARIRASLSRAWRRARARSTSPCRAMTMRRLRPATRAWSILTFRPEVWMQSPKPGRNGGTRTHPWGRACSAGPRAERGVRAPRRRPGAGRAGGRTRGAHRLGRGGGDGREPCDDVAGDRARAARAGELACVRPRRGADADADDRVRRAARRRRRRGRARRVAGVSNTARGLAVGVRGRTLDAHGDAACRGRGGGASISGRRGWD